MGERRGGRGKWMALTAALLGWMFDGLAMGLFPLVARPAIGDLPLAVLAALIGAAANSGYLLVAVLGLWLNALLPDVRESLLGLGLPEDWVEALVRRSGWRLLLILGAVPALLTFFIRLFVPE